MTAGQQHLGVMVILEALNDASQPGVDLLHQEVCWQVIDLGEGGDGDCAGLLQLLIDLGMDQSEESIDNIIQSELT